MTTQPIFMTLRLDHLAVRTPDFAATIDWYVNMLDFSVIEQWTVEGLDELHFAYLQHENIKLEVIGGSAPTAYVPLQTSVPDHLGFQGFIHLCLRVDDLDSTLSNLRRKAVFVLAEPFVNPAIQQRLALIRDNNGNVIELAQAVALKGE